MHQLPRITKKPANYWTTIYPVGREKFLESYYEAIRLMDYDPELAEIILKKIISDCGNCHIGAISQLGKLYCETGNNIEGNSLLAMAHRQALGIFPKSFKPGIDQLNWDYPENRIILNSLHNYASELMQEENFEKALKKFEFILDLNPNDHQGIRYQIIDCLFYLDRPTKVLEIAKRYPDEDSAEFLYGKFLAFYLLDEIEKAKQQFIKAKKAFPFIAEEIIKTEHIFPADEFKVMYGISNADYPIGSRQHAFNYWRMTQQFWNKAKGINEFIAGEMKDSGNKEIQYEETY